MNQEPNTSPEDETLNIVQEILRWKPTYKQLFEEMKQFTQKVSAVRRDNKARKTSIVRPLEKQRPFEGMTVDSLALVRYNNDHTQPNWPYVGYDRSKQERSNEFRLLVLRSFPTDEEVLPAHTLVIFRPRFAYLLEDVDERDFRDDKLKTSTFTDRLSLSRAPEVFRTLDFLEVYTQRELLKAGIGEISVKAVFNSVETE